MQQVLNDLTKTLDHFLNDNIKSILSFAKVITTPEEHDILIQMLKIVLKRRLHSSKEIIVLIKHCILIRRLIEISTQFPQNQRLTFYRVLLSLDENHYNSPFTNSHIQAELESVYNEMARRTDVMLN